MRLGPGPQHLYVPIEPYRDHLRQLLATNATIDAIAQQIGVSSDSIINWMRTTPSKSRKVKTRIRKDFAAQIMSLDVAEARALHDDPYVSAAPSIRRLQALIAHGYTRHTIARGLGIVDNNVGHILSQEVIRRSRAELIAELYPSWAYATPHYRSRKQETHSRLGAARARALGWHGPLDYEDIETGVLADDADTTADDSYVDLIAVDQTLAGDWQPLTGAERLEALRRGRARQLNDSQVADLIHCSGSAIKKLAVELEAEDAAGEAARESASVTELAAWRDEHEDAKAA